MDSATRELLQDLRNEAIPHTVHDGYVQEEYSDMVMDNDMSNDANSDTSPEMAIIHAVCDMALPRYAYVSQKKRC